MTKSSAPLQFPKWIHTISTISMTVAVIMLAVGVFEYGRFAMAEPGTSSWYTSFVWSMTALFFFNLPIVLKKRHARKVLAEQGRLPHEAEDI
jgi:hypothetical protein